MEANHIEGRKLTQNTSKRHLSFLLVVRLRGWITLGTDTNIWIKITPKAKGLQRKQLLPVTPVLPCEQQPGGFASLHHHWRGEAWCHTYPTSLLCPVAECQIQLGSCHCKGKEFMNLINVARMTASPWELHDKFSVFLSLKLLWLRGLLLNLSSAAVLPAGENRCQLKVLTCASDESAQSCSLNSLGSVSTGFVTDVSYLFLHESLPILLHNRKVTFFFTLPLRS